MVSPNSDVTPVAEHLSEVGEITKDYEMEGYNEHFKETVIRDTNWKCLAENFMESYHVPVCHAATVGGVSEVDGADELELPLGRKAFNYRFNYKDEDFKQAHEVIASVQAEDQGCTEKVYRGVCSEAARPGHPSHLVINSTH